MIFIVEVLVNKQLLMAIDPKELQHDDAMQVREKTTEEKEAEEAAAEAEDEAQANL